MMDNRKIACLAAAAFISIGLAASATGAWASPPGQSLVIEGKRIDPRLQRTVSYTDLNLAQTRDQKRLKVRIFRTADNLCFVLNGYDASASCRTDAVHSTDGQVALAIERANQSMAGLSVGRAVAISMVVGVR